MWLKLIKAGGYGMAIKQIADQVNAVRLEREFIRRRRRNKNLAIGLTVGAAVGTATAMLLTPRTGRQNREALARQTNETLGQLRQRASKAKEHAQETLEERKEQARRSAGC